MLTDTSSKMSLSKNKETGFSSMKPLPGGGGGLTTEKQLSSPLPDTEPHFMALHLPTGVNASPAIFGAGESAGIREGFKKGRTGARPGMTWVKGTQGGREGGVVPRRAYPLPCQDLSGDGTKSAEFLLHVAPTLQSFS